MLQTEEKIGKRSEYMNHIIMLKRIWSRRESLWTNDRMRIAEDIEAKSMAIRVRVCRC